MAGHSKWSNIKRKKEKSDAQKGKVFSRISKELAIAVKEGGPDPENNNRLRDAIAKAKTSNMPNDNIMRTIKKAAGDGSSNKFEEMVYEGYGPGGIAIIVEALTDNRNRTAGELRHYFDRFGGNLGQTGCVSFMFDKKGIILIERKDEIDEDTLMMEALDAGAEDFEGQDEFFEIITEPGNFSSVRESLEKEGYEFMEAQVEMVAQTTTELDNPKQAESMAKLIDNLEDLDDVQNVYHNWEWDGD